MYRTIVVGLGNPILSDDGVGVRVAKEVEARLPRRDDITVCEAPVGGVRLAELMEGYERAIIIDAMLDEDGPPGSVRRMTLEQLGDLSPTQHLASAHDTSLTTALEAGRQLGMRVPRDVTIYGVRVANVTDFADKLAPEIERVVPEIVHRVLTDI